MPFIFRVASLLENDIIVYFLLARYEICDIINGKTENKTEISHQQSVTSCNKKFRLIGTLNKPASHSDSVITETKGRPMKEDTLRTISDYHVKKPNIDAVRLIQVKK